MWRQGLHYRHIFGYYNVAKTFKNQHFTRIAICQKVNKSIFYIRLFSAQRAQNPYNCQKYEIKEFELVVTCGEWRQGWTPLV